MTMNNFELKFSMCNADIPFERSVSQNFDLDLTFYFMSKRVTFVIFFLHKFLHFMK